MAYMAPAMAQAPGTAINGGNQSQLSVYESGQFAFSPVKKGTPSKDALCYCVQWAKEYLGITNQSWGWAGRIEPTTETPSIGSVVLTSEGSGHAAVVLDIKNGFLYVVEANYVSCAVDYRTIPVDSPVIRGYKMVN